jgi:hypothetical protein
MTSTTLTDSTTAVTGSTSLSRKMGSACRHTQLKQNQMSHVGC